MSLKAAPLAVARGQGWITDVCTAVSNPSFHLALWFDTFLKFLATCPAARPCQHRWQHHAIPMVAELTKKNCGMQCAVLSSPNIQRLCSSPSEIQTCFIGRRLLNSLSSCFCNFTTNYQWFVLLRCIFEAKHSAWKDPSSRPGRSSLFKIKQTSEWRIFFYQIGCMSVSLLRLWIYVSMDWPYCADEDVFNILVWRL